MKCCATAAISLSSVVNNATMGGGCGDWSAANTPVPIPGTIYVLGRQQLIDNLQKVREMAESGQYIMIFGGSAEGAWTLEMQLKHKFKLFGRNFHAFYLGAFHSVQPQFSPITVFNESAYIRQYSHQLEGYYNLFPDFVLTTYAGWERIIGNYSTRLDVESKRPLNQSNLGLGFGFDYMIAKNTGLYFRHRWFTFEDSSFKNDNFRGHESTIELKIYF
jgi:hypothetical protein